MFFHYLSFLRRQACYVFSVESMVLVLAHLLHNSNCHSCKGSACQAESMKSMVLVYTYFLYNHTYRSISMKSMVLDNTSFSSFFPLSFLRRQESMVLVNNQFLIKKTFSTKIIPILSQILPIRIFFFY